MLGGGEGRCCHEGREAADPLRLVPRGLPRADTVILALGLAPKLLPERPTPGRVPRPRRAPGLDDDPAAPRSSARRWCRGAVDARGAPGLAVKGQVPPTPLAGRPQAALPGGPRPPHAARHAAQHAAPPPTRGGRSVERRLRPLLVSRTPPASCPAAADWPAARPGMRATL